MDSTTLSMPSSKARCSEESIPLKEFNARMLSPYKVKQSRNPGLGALKKYTGIDATTSSTRVHTGQEVGSIMRHQFDSEGLVRNGNCETDSLFDGMKTHVPGFSRTEVALDILSFMFAEVQHMGALTAIYCHSEDKGLGMSLARTGVVMATQYVVSVMLAPVCGHFLDNTTYKRVALMTAFLITASTYFALTQLDSFAAVIVILIVQSATSGMYLPGINTLSLGLVGKQGFTKRATRNEMWRHVGVLLAGVLPMMLIPRLGFHAYFYVCMSMAGVAALTTLLIDDSKIDHAAARGSDDLHDTAELSKASTHVTDLVPYRQLLCRKQIMLTIAAVVLFHLGNAAMLPMTGQKIDELEHKNDTWVEIPGIGEVDGAVGVSMASVIAEGTAIPLTYIAGRLADRAGWGRRRVALIGFAALPIRGVLLASVSSIWGLLTIQLLDGLGGAVVGVVPILMMQDLTDGTGRFTSMQGGVAAALGLGTAISQILAGEIAEIAGFSAMFFSLSGISCVALLCIVLMKETKPTISFKPLVTTMSRVYGTDSSKF